VQLTSADLAAYDPPRRRANVARGILVALLLLDLIAVWSSQAEYSLLERIDSGELVTEAEANRSDNRQLLIGVSQIGIFIVCIVFFIAWFAQAYRNIVALGADSRRYSQGWAIGSWFVPFLNLVRPKRIADDIWRGSDPDVKLERQTDWLSRNVHWVVMVWWAAFLIANWVGNIAARAAFSEDDTIAASQRLDRYYMFSDSLDAVAAALAIVVITMLTARQEARYRRAQAVAEHVPAYAELPFTS
jgi:hypothetical protein